MMNYEPKVTIIIPVYNGSNFLKEAIDSALAQTYKNCEILVINDGSTDNGESEKIALSYGTKIKYFLKENGGVSSALNFAFGKMEGEWFSWLSHDDLYEPEKIEKQIKIINKLKNENPNLNLDSITIRTATKSIDKYGNTIKIPNYKDVPFFEENIDVILNNISNYRLSGCSFLLPASCVKKVGLFNEEIRTVSDVEYWYRLLFSNYRFYCLSNDILVKNRSHGKQVGKTKRALFDKEMTQLFIWIANQMNENPKYSKLSNNEKLYFSLIKRRCVKAARYVKNNFLKNNVGIFKNYVIYPIIGFLYATKGTIRNVARYIYRKVFVK